MVYKVFDKKSTLLADKSASGSAIKMKICQAKSQLKNYTNYNYTIIRKLKKIKVYSYFIENIWGADLADMQLISKINKGIRFLLCAIDIFSKHAWVIPLKDKKGTTIDNDFQKILDESNRKPNKIWVDKGNEIYNRSMKL